ncbi:MAG: hypothetical protein ACREMC_07370 [Gemmatimonadales bacterium]
MTRPDPAEAPEVVEEAVIDEGDVGIGNLEREQAERPEAALECRVDLGVDAVPLEHAALRKENDTGIC